MIGNTAQGYTFGFDIGIASVGWAVLATDRIVALGVRAFDRAEVPKSGESLNLARRLARLTRRRLRRRAWRLTKVARALKRHGILDNAARFGPGGPTKTSPWRLRVKGLDRRLEREEWARVVYHICKHRGFHWLSRADEMQSDAASSDAGRVKQGLADTAKRLAAGHYRSAGEMVTSVYPESQRNKAGEYTKALARVHLADELSLLFERQRALGNKHASVELEKDILGGGDRKSGLFWAQKPALAGSALLAMLGHCTFERTEYRAPKASFTAERHVWLTRLVNLRVTAEGKTRGLTEAERQIALPLPYLYKTELDYKRLKDALVKAGHLPSHVRFAGLSYPSEAQTAQGIGKDPEKASIVRMPAWQGLRQALEKAGLGSEWQKISTAALEGHPDLLDQIAWVLSVFKDDDEVRDQLTQLALPAKDRLVEALLGVRFDKFHALSLKALRAIVPHMERGMRYDEACLAAGYHHSVIQPPDTGKVRLLPPLYRGRNATGTMLLDADMDPPRNPVVLRALNQARKVMNALIREYGSPHAVHVEMARDLSHPLDERKRIEREQEKYRQRNEQDRAEFAQHYGVVGSPRGGDFEKWKLYREQQGKCAYSLQPIDLGRLLETGYVEVDHVLPYSRSFDDSKNNKVLVLGKENRDKGNRTPFEYLDGAGESDRWRAFVVYVSTNKSYRLAKRSRLLRRDFGDKEETEFRDRNLNDTRYICRYFKSYVERHLALLETSNERRCVVLSGQLTAFLRAQWRFVKDRAGSDRHHALDAVVAAACSHAMVKRLSDYARRKEVSKAREGLVDPVTGEIANPGMHERLREHFPMPWEHFRDEVRARIFMDDRAQLHGELQRFGTYSDNALASVEPLFVSRAPLRRGSGAAHKETIYGQPRGLRATGGATERVPLSALKASDLGRLIDPHRNARLYAAIKARMAAYGDKGDKAFSPGNPLHKPDAQGNPTGPLVRSVTLVLDKVSGIPIRGGIARNESMLRIDVFTKAGKFHLVPVYVHHRVSGLPNRAIVAFKDEAEWTLVDETFSFLFSLYPNDLVQVVQKRGASILGYYAGCDRSDGTINLWAHDRSASVGKGGFLGGIGVKTAAALERYSVDVLGRRFRSPTGGQRGLA